jgi:hypothetical protein
VPCRLKSKSITTKTCVACRTDPLSVDRCLKRARTKAAT